MTKISDKIFSAIFIFFNIIGLSLHKVILNKDGRSIVQPSNCAMIISIFTFILMSYSIFINFDRPSPGPSSFIKSDSEKIMSGFLRLVSHMKALVVFIPLWVFYRQGKLIYEYSLQINEIMCKINPKLIVSTISTPTVMKACVLITFMTAYGISQLTYLFAKSIQFDDSWMDWSMIICIVAPNAYAIFCIVHLYFSLTLLSERIKQVNALLKDIFK